MKHKRIILVVVLAFCVTLAGTVAAQSGKPSAVAAAITIKFTHQGQLRRNGALFTGTCDMQFSLWDDATAGTQKATYTPPSQVNVVDGVFTVEVDFGQQFQGDARWIQTSVKCADDVDYTDLPRVALNPTPYAIGLMPGAVINGDIPYGSGNAALKVINASASDGTAVLGQATATSGDTAGVFGLASSPNGAGVWGETDADNARGVVGFGRDPCPPGSPEICYAAHARNATGVVGEALAFGTGVWGRSAQGNGVYGETSEAHTFDKAGVFGRSTGDGGIGVIGEANVGNGWGVYGLSTAGSGVVGTTAAVSTFDMPGVLGKSTGAGGLGVKGEANVGNGWGVYGVGAAGAGVVGQSTSGSGVVGKSTSGYAMQALGHATQSLNADGWVKAMVYVDPSRPSGQQIVQCFNSQLPASAATTPPCGMTATGISLGYWRVNFGFDVTGRFATVTTHRHDVCFEPGPHCAIVAGTSGPTEGNLVGVGIQYAGDGEPTNIAFTLILY